MDQPPTKNDPAGEPAANATADTPQRKSRVRESTSDPLPDNRKSQLLEESARLFGSKGYENTSMRDIAAAFGILPGSLYHHFGSKDELFTAVYAEGINTLIAAVEKATAPHTDPWKRLEAGFIAHLESLFSRDTSASAVLADWSTFRSEELRAALVKERDRYEAVLSRLTDAVDLPAGVKRHYFQLAILGAFNWALTWYRPGRDSPATVAKQLLAVFRPTAEAVASAGKSKAAGSKR